MTSAKHHLSQAHLPLSESDRQSITNRSAAALDMILVDMADSGFDKSSNISDQHEPANAANAQMIQGKSLLAEALQNFMAEADYSDDEMADTMSEGE